MELKNRQEDAKMAHLLLTSIKIKKSKQKLPRVHHTADVRMAKHCQA